MPQMKDLWLDLQTVQLTTTIKLTFDDKVDHIWFCSVNPETRLVKHRHGHLVRSPRQRYKLEPTATGLQILVVNMGLVVALIQRIVTTH